MVMNRSAPTATVVPILVHEDVGQAIDWLCRAFGFAERLRVERDGVIGHAQLTMAEGAIMLGRQGGPFRAPHGDEVSAYVQWMMSTATSSVRSRMAPALPNRRTTCRLVSASTALRTMRDIGGRFHNTSPMWHRRNGAPR